MTEWELEKVIMEFNIAEVGHLTERETSWQSKSCFGIKNTGLQGRFYVTIGATEYVYNEANAQEITAST